MTISQSELALTLFVGLASLVLTSCASASESTLQSMGDKVRIVEAIYAPSSFSDSCQFLENSVHQVLRHAPEDLGVYHLADKVELKVNVAAEGKKAFQAKDCSVHELLRRFGTTWNVSVRVKANTISIEALPEGIKK